MIPCFNVTFICISYNNRIFKVGKDLRDYGVQPLT